jgi:hypothetical protein
VARPARFRTLVEVPKSPGVPPVHVPAEPFHLGTASGRLESNQLCSSPETRCSTIRASAALGRDDFSRGEVPDPPSLPCPAIWVTYRRVITVDRSHTPDDRSTTYLPSERSQPCRQSPPRWEGGVPVARLEALPHHLGRGGSVVLQARCSPTCMAGSGVWSSLCHPAGLATPDWMQGRARTSGAVHPLAAWTAPRWAIRDATRRFFSAC